MRVLLISDTDDWILHEVAVHLAQRLSERMHISVLVAHSENFGEQLKSYQKKCDVVHFLSPWDFFKWSKFTYIPCVLTLWHMVDWSHFDEHVGRLDGICVPSQQWFERVVERIPKWLPAQRLRYGLDIGRFKPDSSARTEFLRKAHLSSEVLTFGFAGSAWGNEGGRKGLDRLWNCFIRLKRETNIPFVLRIIGRDWPSDMVPVELREVVQLGPFIHSPLLPSFYSSLDYYVCISRVEGYAYPVLESMCSGCVLLTTEVGIVPEILIDGENGFLLCEESLEADFLNAVRRTAFDRAFREKCGNAARKVVTDCFSWEKVVDPLEFEQFYATAINAYRSRPILQRTGFVWYSKILRQTNGLRARFLTSAACQGNQGSNFAQPSESYRSAVSPKPFVTVVLPTCNRGEYLEKATRSLLAQNYPLERFEIIVVDNGSTGTALTPMRNLIQEVAGKVNLSYTREDRRGLVFTRHTGAAHAEGDILLFGDDDAVFDSNWISAVVDVYLQHPEVGVVGTKIGIRWDCAPEPWVHRYEGVLGKLDYGDQTIVRHGLFINGGSFSIRKQVLLQMHGFNPGQREDYIVGDSETGLCRKLANAGIPVGWTPAATMWHLQQAKINGTLDDLKRRYRNNGICDAYYATFYGWNPWQILVDIWHKTYRLVRRTLGAIRHRDQERLRYDIPLEIAYYVYYLRYMWLYRLNSTIRGEVMKRDWEFGPNYKAPPIVFSHSEAYDKQDDLKQAGLVAV